MKHYILLISGIISVGLSSYLSAATPFGMQNQQVISELYTTIITPAGFTFSIWGLIYASWIIFGIYVAYKKIELPKNSVYLLALAQIISTLWLIPSQYGSIALSFVIMIGIFALLYILVEKNEKNKYFSYIAQLFCGWIVIASIANLHQTLVYFDIYYYPVVLGVLSIIAGFVLNLYFFRKYNYMVPFLVFIWALFGIIIGQDNIYIIGSASMAMIATATTILLQLYEKK